VAVLIRTIYLHRKKEKYYKRLLTQIYPNEAIAKGNEKNDSTESFEYAQGQMIFESNEMADINPFIIENILAFLDKFEKEKKFLQKDLTLQSLAQQCGTNSSYFSKVINYYKRDNFLSYLNNLRLTYVVELWKINPKSRHLRIQEISLKAGFSTAQSFSKNFKEKYQISPSYFLKRLDKDSDAENLQ
jgi:AraC-like DNA-binding protein